MTSSVSLTMEPYAKQLALKVDKNNTTINSRLDSLSTSITNSNQSLTQLQTNINNQITQYQTTLSNLITQTQTNLTTQITQAQGNNANKLEAAQQAINDQLQKNQSDLTTLSQTQATLTSQINQNNTNLTTQINQNQSLFNQKIVDIENNLSTRITQNQTNIAVNSKNIAAISTTLSKISSSNSSKSLANIALIDRYGITQDDVIRFLKESAEQKAQGQAYASKYALTPQNFYADNNGNLIVTPYGNPPTDGKYAIPVESRPVPMITDSCWQYYDSNSGIHYRWDQFQHNSQSYRASHWTLDGPCVSVSVDGLKWTVIRTLLYAQTGAQIWTGFFIDRDNRLGGGNNSLVVSSNTTGTSWALPNVWSGNGSYLGPCGSGHGDHRIYWDGHVTGGFLVLSLDNSAYGLIIRTGTNLNNITDTGSYPGGSDPMLSRGSRTECPSWVLMNDQVAGQPQRQVISIALQTAPGVNTPYTYLLATCTYSATGITMIQPLRTIEYGFLAYAQILVDPLQHDGTGGTPLGCDVAVINIGSYNWRYLNNSGFAVPQFGFGGGQHLPADCKLVNGIPMALPSAVFKNAMTGPSYTKSGSGGTNPGWILYIPTRNEVWRAELDITTFTFASTTTIRFHFGYRWCDFIIGNTYIDVDPSNSGTTVIYPNNRNGDNTSRNMPMTRSFVTNTGNTLVWEYDNGKIRIYNTNTGEHISEMIFPDSLQLSSIEILGNDMFVGGFTMAVNQDNGFNY